MAGRPAPPYRDDMPVIRRWNTTASDRIWAARIGPENARRLAGVRLPAYRALAAFVVLLVVAAAAAALAPAPVGVVVAALAVLAGSAVVGVGVRPLRAEGHALAVRLRDLGHRVDRDAPLNDGGAFDRWAARNGLPREQLVTPW
ncbi:hypothetical protein DEI92_06320 [Curtobacterium sp. MCBD17_034]|nr:hypothetical protein DEI92_06320 [Curtobacterium sp. MCBD17_034]PZM33137.1 hypothetical protein DEI90_14305 [Curtobacterium sp. MCBD17_031]